ncbi:hypothetical protein BDV29DRAFT_186252 [Aspergillus leporis]|uniref:Glycosyltransferase family 31 protein n=1 Tax=Aspergillus leporis TaxID=41062 RepID=A0A5N5WGC9_9EURO|nr:hypothetical protein BDV29DRAFT_186252 [Aspergillus leporis]
MPSPRLLRMRQPLKSVIAASLFLTAGTFLLFSKVHLFEGSVEGVAISYVPEEKVLKNDPTNHRGCYVDLDLLKPYGYNDSVEYERWEIAVTRSKNFNGFSNNLSVPVPEFETIQLDTDDHQKSLPQAKCAPMVTIEAPLPVARVDASHLVFGVATSLERLNDSLDQFAHWAGGTNARLFAMVEIVPSTEKSWVLRRAGELGINLTIIESPEEWLDRYFHLTRILLRHRDTKTQWAVVIDDDTFFPSMANLIDRLATYDHSEPQYIGAPTENFSQMSIFSYMAYGGAGIFLSIPLLLELDEVYDECYELKDHGDKRISQCIYQHTTTKLTWDHRLFQMDLGEDVTGFYESGRPLPLSLHHWKSWFAVDVVALGKVAPICGDDCQLRRWRISDTWFLVNGFSIVQYSSPMKDMIGMEQTWDPSPEAREQGYAFSLGPLRPKDEGKVSYRMKSAIPEGQSLRQIYVYEPSAPSRPRIVEVVWSFSI